MITHRSWLLGILGVLALAGCSARRNDSPRALRTEVFASSDLGVVVFEDGSLSVRRLATGVRRMRVAAFDAAAHGFGHDYEVPVCPIRLTPDAHLVVTYGSAIHVYSLMTGRRVADLPYVASGPPQACPNVAPDSTLLVHIPRYHGSGLLLKLRTDGTEIWRHQNPDIGPLLGSIEVDARTGNAILTSATHLIAVDPAGRPGWAYRHPQPGGR